MMNQTILVVDDSSVAREMMIRSLKMIHHADDRFLQAGDGHEAIDVLAREQVQLVLADINMPGMNGIEFVTAMRHDPDLCDIPVVIVSSEKSQARLALLEDQGVQGYLRKPFRPEDVKNVLSQFLGQDDEEYEDDPIEISDSDDGSF